MASEHKPTLQLRHQICGNGITITASAYDTRRHHLLLYDALAQGVTAHTLRLFSLRREIRMTPLFDNENKPLHSNIRQEHSKATVTAEEIAATTITYISLVYSYENDVFVCVYNAFKKPPAPAKGVKKPPEMVVARYNVLFLEPATLKKLVTYPGPMTHDLRCAHFDEASSRLVLASRLRADQVHSRGSVRLLATTGDKSNAIDILHVSKRPFRTSTTSAEPRIMLCVEKTRQSIAYAEALGCMTATANLQVVYGTGMCEYEDEKDDVNERPRDSFILEWRRDEENQLQLTRRIVHADDPITAMTVAEESGWLFTGHESGQLRVWNMRSENTSSSTWTSTGGHHDSAVSSIQLQSVQAPRNGGCVEAMVFTTERRFGDVRHWQFIVSTSVSGAPTVRFECVDVLDVAPSDRNSNSPKKISRKQQLLLDQRRIALLLCVSIDMETFAEKLVLVTRGDMIHVIKVQALLKIVHRVLGEDQVVFMRLHNTESDGSGRLLCVRGSQVYGTTTGVVRKENPTLECRSDFALAVPPPHRSARLTSIEFCQAPLISLVAYGWSSGVVEVYDAIDQRRLLLLQDPRLNAEVSAVAISVDSREVFRNSTSVASVRRESSSWGGLVKATNVSNSTKIMVIAGSSCGEMYSWKAAVHRGSSTCHFILEASVRLLDPAVHSTHVVSIKQLHSLSVLSMSADGMLKLWSLPAMTLISYLNAASATRIGMCSCLEIMKDDGNEDKYVVVGYEDGVVGAWRVNRDESQFRELTVGSHHERQVTRFCQVQTTREDVEFLSSSLDTMVILWRILGDEVQELRYFELGQPIVDFTVLCQRVFVAFSQELCWFACREDAKKHDVLQREDLNQGQAEQRPDLDESTELTVKIVEDLVEPILTSTPDHAGASMTSMAHENEGDVINIPSVTIPDSPVALSLETLPTVTTFQTRVGTTNSSMIEGWQTDSSKEERMDGEVLTVYLQQYIQTHGVNDTLVVGDLNHFLALHHLPLAKRPANALAIYLQTHPIDPAKRLTLDEARSILQDLQQRGLGGNGTDSAQPGHLLRIKSLKKKQTAVKKRRRQERDLRNRVPIVSYNILGEKTVEWVEASPTVGTNQESSLHRDFADGDPNAVRKHKPNSRSRRHLPSPSIKEFKQSMLVDFPDEGLVQRIQISQTFAPLWSNGYCWCPGLSVIVQWDDSETQPQVCGHCCHRRHTLRLLRKGYKPHFTLRMILEVIVDVYESLLPRANAILYNNDAGGFKTEQLSIHHALFQLFKHRYGIQSIVETKLKLLFVSMCHVVRQIDGVAVFGELLGLFARTGVDEQAPDHIVALCVCAYGWLYSREMVVNGSTLLGSNGGESDNVHTSKTTHWQFVRLANALFCAQELLRYPLVSPLYLHNIMRFAEDYSQLYPSTPDDLTDEMYEGEANSMTRWLEMHRFLRMLVGEWKQQTTAFRSVEELLFVAPLSSPSTSLKSEPLTQILESLRLILSCFVFYDHDRAGVLPVHDFTTMLRRLKYLWPNEHLTEQEATRSTRYHDSLTFENAIFAAQKRFRDTERDGRLCYLDFWAMLYIVGVKTASLLKFREIPSFCKDYKLEISPELRDHVVTYMQCASSLLLPRGFQQARSSINEEAKVEHRRRVGGLHDGMFAIDRTLASQTLSVQELLGYHGDKTDDNNDVNRAGRIYVDGSLPALRKNVSTSILDASRMTDDKQTRTSPVVVGIRPSGPHPKPVALISATALENDDLPHSDKSSSKVHLYNPICQSWQTDSPVLTHDPNALSRSEMSSSSFGNIYIQFPNISPRHTRVECLSMTGVQQRTIGTPAIDEDDETHAWKQHILSEHDAAEVEEERRRLEHEQRFSPTLTEADAVRAAAKAMATRLHSFSKLIHSPSSTSLSPPKEATSPTRSPKEKFPPDKAVAPALALPATQTTMKSGRKTQREETVVVIPTIEKETTIEVLSTARRSPVRERTRRSVINNHEVIGHLEASDAASTEDDAFVHNDLQDWSTEGFDGDEALSPTPLEGETHLKMTTEATPAPVASRENSTPNDRLGVALLDVMVSSVETVEPKLTVEKVIAINEAQEAIGAPRNVTPVKPVPDSSVVVTPTLQLSKAPMPESFVSKTHPHEAMRVLDALAGEKGITPVVLAPVIDLPIASAEPKQTVEVTNIQPAPIPTIKPSPPKVTAKPSKKAASIQPETPAVANSSQRHHFKFSQQPQFQSSAAVNTNPLRARGWSPGDDSASDGDDDYADECHRRQCPRTRTHGDEEDDAEVYDEADDDSIAVEDMQMRLSPKSVASLRQRYRSDPNYRRTKLRPLGAFPPSFAPGTGDVSATNKEECLTERRGTHLENEAEGVLYGEYMTNDLGEGIVFSPEAEKAMQEKWNSIFSQAETSMFSPLKAQIESREAALREQEEQQSRLMKKRLEQQAQDDLRLRRNSMLTTANGMVGGDVGSCAPSDTSVNNFRTRRLTREVCFLGQHQLQYGTTTHGDLKHTHNTQLYHFLYSPETHGSILTIRLHVTRGDAEMFVSTETKAPCSSDFMWRSSLAPTVSTDPNELHPGQKIVLFPHDLARVLSEAATERTTTITFYVSVVALETRTSFMIGVMASGQTPEASRAVQMVDNLIERFNHLSHSFQNTPSESDRGAVLTRRASGLTPSRRVSRLKARLAELQQDTDNDQGDGDDDAPDMRVSTSPMQRNEDHHVQVDEECETTSFQQLLESMSKGSSVDQDGNGEHSLLLSSQPEISTARDFLEDEVQRLQETYARLSPVKMQTVVTLETSTTAVEGLTDAIATVAHRRLSSGSRRRLTRLQQQLSPLKAKAQRAHQQENGHSASLKVAMYEPKRVAYSLSSLRAREKR